MNDFILWSMNYIFIASLTAGLYSAMASAANKNAPGSVLIAAGLFWPIMLPFAIAHLFTRLFI